MIRFLHKSVVLIILIIGLIYLYGLVVNQLFYNGSYFKSQWINSLKDKNIDCVIIGNSRASLLSMNKDKVDYLNLAQDGIGMKITYLQLYLYFKNKNRTKYVILQGDYLSFNKTDDSRRSPRWLPYFSDPIIFGLLKNEHNTFKYQKYFPALNYILFNYDWGVPSLINNLFDLKKSPWGERGYYNVCQSFVNEGPLGSVDYKNYKQNLFWVEKINKLCKENNTALIVITSPYYNMQDTITDVELFKSRLVKNDIYYFDFSRHFLGKSKLFRDNNHLNCFGVNEFQDTLTNMLLKIKNIK